MEKKIQKKSFVDQFQEELYMGSFFIRKMIFLTLFQHLWRKFYQAASFLFQKKLCKCANNTFEVLH